MYHEIKYAKATSLNLPHALPLLKLQSRGKCLPIQQYPDNLAQYLDDSRSMSTLITNDLNHVLSKLQGLPTIYQIVFYSEDNSI